jgi:cytochrome c-type biogenesis protein CcmH/NrfG
VTARRFVWVLVAAAAVYLLVIAQRAWLLLTSGAPVAMVMGAALLALPAIGGYLLGRELQFGVQAEDLARRLESEGAVPDDVVPLRPSGRSDRAAAAALFDRYRGAVEADPQDWRTWYRLGLVYDAAGDRRRARGAVRTAIRLAAQSPR